MSEHLPDECALFKSIALPTVVDPPRSTACQQEKRNRREAPRCIVGGHAADLQGVVDAAVVNASLRPLATLRVPSAGTVLRVDVAPPVSAHLVRLLSDRILCPRCSTRTKVRIHGEDIIIYVNMRLI
jgi:hypothetical protein